MGAEEETKKVNTDVPEAEAPPAEPVPGPEVPVASKDETEEKSVVTEERSIEEEAKPVVAPETKKSARFFGLWSKSKKKETLEPASVPEPAAVPEPKPEPKAPVVEAPKEEIEEKVVVPPIETEDTKPEDTTIPATADAKKSSHLFKLPHLPWKKSPKPDETVETSAVPESVPEAEPEVPVVVEEKSVIVPEPEKSSHLFKLPHLPWKKSPKKADTVETTPSVPETESEVPVVVEEKSVIVPESEEKTEDQKPDVDATETKKSGGFLKLSSIKWPKTKKKESLESLPSAVPVEESEATLAESLKVEVDEKSIVTVEEEKADDSKPVVADDGKKVGGFFNLGSLSWKKTQTKESSEETVEEKKDDEGSNRDMVLTKAAYEKTQTLIQAWEDSEKAKVENKAEKKLSIIVSAENSKKAAAEAELKKIEEKLETIKAENIEKLKNREALIHKVAEEKRAAVEAKRAEELLIAEETAAKYRATNSAPKKLLLKF